MTGPHTDRSAEVSAEPRFTFGLWLVASAVTFWSFGFTILRGSDLWWHLAGGRWTFEHGFPPLADPFSFTAAGERWIVDAWLSDLLFHVASLAFGLASLAWWKWATVVAVFLVLFLVLRRLGRGCSPAAYLCALLAAAVAAPFLDLRPQLYSFLGLAVLLLLTLRRERAAWWLPGLFLLWANLHAGVVLGLLFLPVVLLPGLRRTDAAGRRRIGVLALACTAASLINPNGYRIFSQPLLYALDTGSPFRNLAEWHSPFAPGGIRSTLYPWAVGLFACVALYVLVRGFRRGRDTVPWVELLLGALGLAMSLTSRRFIPVFAICQTLLLVRVLAPALRPALRALPRALAVVLPLLALAVGMLRLAPYPLSSSAFPHLTAQDEFPVETLDFIERNRIAGNVYAYYNWGGYVSLRTRGRVAVFIDGRANTVFGPETYTDYLRVLNGKPGWRDVIEGSGADLFLWPRRGGPVRALLAGGRWQLLHGDAVSSLLVRAGRAPAAPLEPTLESAYRELALAVRWLDEGQPSRAGPHLERALELDPDVGLAWEYLARLQFAGGDADAARRTLDASQQRFPSPHRLRSFEEWAERFARDAAAGTAE